MTETFEPGELFIYEKAPGVYELGVTKWQRDEHTWFCYYSTGDTAAATPIANMRKVTNAKWAPIRWAYIWGWNRLNLDDLLCVIPGKHMVLVNQTDTVSYRGQLYEGTAYNVPDCFRNLRVTGVRVGNGFLVIEVCSD